MPKSLMEIVQETLIEPNNSILAFCDNASAIRGNKIKTILPSSPGIYLMNWHEFQRIKQEIQVLLSRKKWNMTSRLLQKLTIFQLEWHQSQVQKLELVEGDIPIYILSKAILKL
jgi:hypothetical protein